mgnify:FL=1
MNLAEMFVAALFLIPATGLVTWAWFAMAQVEARMGALDGFEGMHFEIGPQAAEHAEGAPWPTRG